MYVQPIFVVPDHPQDRVICAAAKASVLALAEIPSPFWALWLQGPFTKTVRRIKSQERLETLKEQYSDSTYLEDIALASVPMPYAEFPKPFQRAQVTGWDNQVLPPSTAQSGQATIYLNETLEMTTGKMAAQAAHALMKLYLAEKCVPSVKICMVPQERLESMDTRYAIKDNGLTEIAPGSLTAVLVEE